MKECRKIEITNFKNIGIRQSTTLDLPPKNSGDLIFIIGENNVGKSNVLDALQAFGNKSFNHNDKPSFVGYEDCIPSITLIESKKSGDEDVEKFETSYIIGEIVE